MVLRIQIALHAAMWLLSMKTSQALMPLGSLSWKQSIQPSITIWSSDQSSESPDGDPTEEYSHNHSSRSHHNNGASAPNATMEVIVSENSALSNRVTQLEELVAKQTVELRRLQAECKDLTEAAGAFARVVELLREAGLPADLAKGLKEEEEAADSETESRVVEYFDDSAIFGVAPSSVIEAADAAGAAILAMVLAGKQRMIVDVRDAELSRDPETLVQFIELAILPVAAGLEGMISKRNRLKIIFPTVSELLTYRRTMALAAPEVVALSTFGLEPVEQQDNLVVIVAPSPDDVEGLAAMGELLSPTASDKQAIKQPIVVLNHHMVPISGPAASFEVAYHLRLLSVQYMSEKEGSSFYSQYEDTEPPPLQEESPIIQAADSISNSSVAPESTNRTLEEGSLQENGDQDFDQPGDAALSAAMQRAHQSGAFTGLTRAMVIRAYPKPWHVFVDTNPGTDADFEVAAMFDDEPTTQDINLAIVECLEGSEQEDDLVAQQMQEALEAGQLDRVSRMLKLLEEEDENDEDDDEDEQEMDPWGKGVDST